MQKLVNLGFNPLIFFFLSLQIGFDFRSQLVDLEIHFFLEEGYLLISVLSKQLDLGTKLLGVIL
jgi:hypothetical protein